MRYLYHRHRKLHLMKFILYPLVDHSYVVYINFSLQIHLFFSRKLVHTLNFLSLRQVLNASKCSDSGKAAGKSNPETSEATDQAFEGLNEPTTGSLSPSKGSY
jgi:hypothetical protein